MNARLEMGDGGYAAPNIKPERIDRADPDLYQRPITLEKIILALFVPVPDQAKRSARA